MAVSATYTPDEYTGDASTVIFPYTFKIFAEADMRVILIDTSVDPQTETVQTLTSDYSVSGVGVGSGGNVTMVVAPSADEELLLKYGMDVTQPYVYTENDPFPAKTHENALDRLCILLQQTQEEIDRCVKSSEGGGETVELADLQAILADCEAALVLCEAELASCEAAVTAAEAAQAAAEGVFDERGVWTVQQYFDEFALTSGSSVEWDLDNQVATLTLGHNVTFAEPTNIHEGVYTVTITQAAAIYTVAWHATYVFEDDTAPVMPDTDGYVMVVVFKSDGTTLRGRSFWREV